MWHAEKLMIIYRSAKRKDREDIIDEYIENFDKSEKFGTTSQGNITKKVDGFILKRIARPNTAGPPKFVRTALESFNHEITIAKNVNHENIIRFIGTKVTDRFGYILQELGTPSYDPPDHRNLRDTTFCDRLKISTSDIFCAVTHDFSRGLHYLHSLHFIASDVKLKNSVMFDVGPNLRFKLIDFGQAAKMSDTIGIGNPFMPPECIISNPRYNISQFTDEDRSLGNTKLDEFILGSVLLDILMWTQDHDRKISYAFETIYELDRNDFTKMKLRSIPSTNVTWLDALISTLPSRRLSMEDLSKISKQTLKLDFEKLVNLPFSNDYENFKYRDDSSSICMRPLSDAY